MANGTTILEAQVNVNTRAKELLSTSSVLLKSTQGLLPVYSIHSELLLKQTTKVQITLNIWRTEALISTW